MKNFLIGFLLLALSVAVPLASGQELLTLDEAVAIALKQNHSIRVARNQAEIGRNSAHIGNAGLLPRLDLNSNASYNKEESQSTTGAGVIDSKYTVTSANLQLNYTLFNGLSNVYTYKKLKTASELGELQARNAIEYDLIGVINSYYGVASATENLNIARELVAISNERYLRAKNRFDFGQANKIDVLNAEVDLNADSVTYQNAVLSLEEARRNLNVLLNRDVDNDFSVEPRVDFIEQMSIAELNRLAVEYNASYLMSAAGLKDANYDVKIARAAFMPNLSLQSSYGYYQRAANFEVGLDDPYRDFSAVASLSFNLFDGRQKCINRQNAKLALDNQKLLADQAKLDLRKALKNAFAAYKNSRYILDVQQRNLESVQLNFDRTQELFNLGQVTSTQFREAQLNLIRARNNISNAKYNAKTYEYDLLRLSGQLVKKDDA